MYAWWNDDRDDDQYVAGDDASEHNIWAATVSANLSLECHLATAPAEIFITRY